MVKMINLIDIGRTQLLNCQWNSSGIDNYQVLKYQVYLLGFDHEVHESMNAYGSDD